MPALDLFNVFSGRVFRIPDYQRGYAWGERQLTELWDDIDELILENGEYRKHYTGTLFIEKIDAIENERWLKGSKFYHVIDGQQRLTTICILLYELLKLTEVGYSQKKKEELIGRFIYESNLTGRSRVYRFSYDPDDKNHKFLLHKIFEDKTVILENGVLNSYTQNLVFAKDFFSTKLKNLGSTQLEILFDKLTTALQFDVREIDEDLNVQAVFETLNNRGKPLSTLEKLKNRLIYLNEKLPDLRTDQNALREKINHAWGKIYSALAQNPEDILDEDVFLSAHLSLHRKPAESVFSEKSAEEKVFQMFCNRAHLFDRDESGTKEDKVTASKIEDYIIKLSEAAPLWYNLHNSNVLAFQKVLLLSSSKDVKIFVLALLYRVDQETYSRLLDKLEKLLFRNRVLWLFDERNLATWARDIYSNGNNATTVEEQIDALLASPMSSENLIQSMNLLFTYVKGNKGFHRWPTLKYFLFEYENKLKADAQEDNDKVKLSDFDDTTIEHIIPQQYSDYWEFEVNEFITDLDGDKCGMAVKVLVNTLGNLTILKGGKNSSVGNRRWTEKQARFRTGSYNEIDISQHTTWGKKQILKRGLDMLSFLESKVAGLALTDLEKRRLLFFEGYLIEKLGE